MTHQEAHQVLKQALLWQKDPNTQPPTKKKMTQATEIAVEALGLCHFLNNTLSPKRRKRKAVTK